EDSGDCQDSPTRKPTGRPSSDATSTRSVSAGCSGSASSHTSRRSETMRSLRGSLVLFPEELGQPELESARFARLVEEVGTQLLLEPFLKPMPVQNSLPGQVLDVCPIPRAVP